MPNHFFIKQDGRHIRIDFNDIVYLEACRNYSKLVMEKNTSIALVSLRQMDSVLPAFLFCRIHRSYIISLSHLTGFSHEQVWLGKVILPISESYRQLLYNRVTIVTSDIHNKKSLGLTKTPDKKLVNGYF